MKNFIDKHLNKINIGHSLSVACRYCIGRYSKKENIILCHCLSKLGYLLLLRAIKRIIECGKKEGIMVVVLTLEKRTNQLLAGHSLSVACRYCIW